MRTALALVLVLAAGCASVPAYKHDDEAQRLKEGSLLHAYGAGLVTTGIVSVLGSGIVLGVGAANPPEGKSNTTVLGGVVGMLAGLGLAIVGGTIIGNGNDDFTPPPIGALAAAAPSEEMTAWQTCSRRCEATRYRCGPGQNCGLAVATCKRECGLMPTGTSTVGR